jgi:transposase
MIIIYFERRSDSMQHTDNDNRISEKLNAENAALKNENAVLRDELAEVKEQLNWLKKQVFGRKTEQSSVVLENGEQLSMLPDDQMAASFSEPKEIEIPAHKRKVRRKNSDWMSNLEIEEVYHEVENRICDKCGSEMKRVGTEKAYDELVRVPEKFFIRRHFTETIKCTNCGTDESKDQEGSDIEKNYFRKSTVPGPIIPHSYCSSELLGYIIYERFRKSLPYYRLESDFKSKGVPLSRETLSNWTFQASEKWGMQIWNEMKRVLIEDCNVIHADETVIQVLHEKGRSATNESKMWVYCNGKISDKNIIVFEYQPTRKSEHPINFLKGFSGFLVCDGYAGYNKVPDVTRCGCLAHLRRRFINAVPNDKSLHSTSAAVKAVRYCDNIYHAENALSECESEIRYQRRLAEVKPLLDEFFAWLETLPVSGKSKLVEAIKYSLNERKYIYGFLENPDVPIDNNRCENAIRNFTIGRKNWLFCNATSGAKASAVWYSIVSTAHANGINVERYLSQLFSLPQGTLLMPWDK